MFLFICCVTHDFIFACGILFINLYVHVLLLTDNNVFLYISAIPCYVESKICVQFYERDIVCKDIYIDIAFISDTCI